MDILRALEHPELLGPLFGVVAGEGLPESWRPWGAFLRQLFGLPMSAEEKRLARRCSGLKRIVPRAHREAYAVVGRRGGKSRIAAAVAAYLAAFGDYSKNLAPGERGMVLVIGPKRDQARATFGFLKAAFEVGPLAGLVTADRATELELDNRITVRVDSPNLRTIRGYTVVAAVLEELAFWRFESELANPDKEVVAALRPAMMTVPGALLLGISSPYAKSGVLWEAYRDYHGKAGDVLVWQAPTLTMNSTVDAAWVKREIERDPAANRAEYLAEFREDIESYISPELVEELTVPGRVELPRDDRHPYVAFCDPSGGRGDAMTLGVAHCEGETAVLDALRIADPPFNPQAVVDNSCEALRSFGLSSVRGDRYAGEWVTQAFADRGVLYEASELVKSDIFLGLVPLLSARRVELLDNPRLQRELSMLERRKGRGGKDTIDHPRGGHDDLANAAAGALVMAAQPQPEVSAWWAGEDDD